jgi:hypothetical protein
MNACAPVLIPTLCRYEHLRRCVSSLAACTHAARTDLFVALDAPLHESHRPGSGRIADYLPQITGFASVNVVRRAENYGALRNYLDARRLLFETYDRVILCEDDNELAPCFLDYVNQGLQRFEGDAEVMAVCGYHFPVTAPVPATATHYLHRGFCAWGFGEWRSRALRFLYPHRDLVKLSRDLVLMRRMMARSSAFFAQFMQALVRGTDVYGDLAIGVDLSRNPQSRCVFPCVSMVRNHGHDGSGVHCGYAPRAIFPVQDIDGRREFAFRDAAPMGGSALARDLRRYVSVAPTTRVKLVLMYLAYRLGFRKRAAGRQGGGTC